MESDNNKILCMCYECRIEAGYVPKDDGAHTSVKKVCRGCNEIKRILPLRHWKLKEQNGV